MGDEVHHSIRQLLAQDAGQALDRCADMLRRDPADAEAHRLAARALRALRRDAEAERHELAAIDAAAGDEMLQQAAVALLDNRLHLAEPILRQRLKDNPFDVAAIRMLAELAGRIGRNADAEKLLRRALELAPGFTAARANLATALHRQNKTAEALEQLDRLQDRANPAFANLRAAVLGRLGDFDEAIALYEDIVRRGTGQPKIWMSYGHALKTVGRTADSIAAYRRATALRPAFGEAWWSIANLKTAPFDAADIAAMEQALHDAQASAEDRLHLHFALGKAMSDRGDAEPAFAHYAQANRLRRAAQPYEAARTSRAVDAALDLFTPDFFAARQGMGCPAPDPIFIIGLPRAGSTLIEQILSSHSQVEGTMELPDLPALVAELRQEGDWPAMLASLDAARLRALGEAYIERTRIQRREGRPFFIDKLPNNWLHVGLIHLILPNARIIDARRHPLDCGYSNFRQHFARGQEFSYDLGDIGHYYADYVRLMAHFDAVLPGQVRRVVHERLLDDPEAEVRALLTALHLPFEDACLQFHENRRAVRTASSEQVRRPINRDGEGQWRAVETQLQPLIATLGPVLQSYPDAP
ncbi:tetratricopeptide repeat-containing sulfotransferase family protein [Sphingobium sp. EM0848]|uniref:tetratricopeptide repeat-containing sulfotransferase family protein n=1 Tax=Sphingobium sp. EM0848 TaxID=2743473 RepID=UPI00159C68EA|nr:tetratricopeptide repeat-containing sulfotransferase family protein [Sphingobium sp. EM0848]